MPELTVNGRAIAFKLDPATPLLWGLRDAANLTGTKYGCGEGDCGACMVLVDGAALIVSSRRITRPARWTAWTSRG